MNRLTVKRFIFLLAGFSALAFYWAIAYLGTNLLYEQFGWTLPLWLTQVINSFIGLFLFMLMVFLITRVFHPGPERQRMFFQSITDAMKQMAQGNFDVELPKISGREEEQNPFNSIVDHLNDMAKNLGEMEEMRQEFISNVSHEIQSPLTSISGFAQALQAEELTVAERQRYSTIIETESRRLSKLSDNLLRLTYLESESQQLNMETYRLDQQLQQIILACEPQWQNKQLAMQVELEVIDIEADEALMNQVWFNLLHNAIKFTETGGTIKVKANQSEAAITVTITDSGIGMTEEEMLHVFERFYKADKARSRDTSGSGLGLAIVKKIVSLHDASLQVESGETGTTFTVSWSHPAGKE